jgi:hypothetical protein
MGKERSMNKATGSSEYFEKVAGDWDQIRQGYFGNEV